MKSLYLLLNFFAVLIPFIFSYHPKLNFYKHFKAFFIANTLVAVIFIAWDIVFTRIGVWGFNPTYISGLYLLHLPIEEILFFICIPFSCVFTYHCLNLFFKIAWKPVTENLIILTFSILLLLIGIYSLPKLYTSSTFISLPLVLLAIKYIAKVSWLPKLFFSYTILLIPFFIINGILTGSGLENPVVWYNNDENLGIRILTIPVEDIFYGFELILLNVFLFEYLKQKFSSSNILPKA